LNSIAFKATARSKFKAAHALASGENAMKMMKTFCIFVTIMMLVITCTSKNLKKESEKAYPNKEWQRPPAHWSPP
jgi:hypothetical protein